MRLAGALFASLSLACGGVAVEPTSSRETPSREGRAVAAAEAPPAADPPPIAPPRVAETGVSGGLECDAPWEIPFDVSDAARVIITAVVTPNELEAEVDVSLTDANGEPVARDFADHAGSLTMPIPRPGPHVLRASTRACPSVGLSVQIERLPWPTGDTPETASTLRDGNTAEVAAACGRDAYLEIPGPGGATWEMLIQGVAIGLEIRGEGATLLRDRQDEVRMVRFRLARRGPTYVRFFSAEPCTLREALVSVGPPGILERAIRHRDEAYGR